MGDEAAAAAAGPPGGTHQQPGKKQRGEQLAPHRAFYTPCATLLCNQDFLQDWQVLAPLKDTKEWRCFKHQKRASGSGKEEYTLPDNETWPSKTHKVYEAMVERYVELNFGAPIRYLNLQDESSRAKATEIRAAATAQARKIIPKFEFVGMDKNGTECYVQHAVIKVDGVGKKATVQEARVQEARVKEYCDACFDEKDLVILPAVVAYDWLQVWQTPFECNTLDAAKQRLTVCLNKNNLGLLLPEKMLKPSTRRTIESALRRKHPLGVEWNWTFSEKLNSIVPIDEAESTSPPSQEWVAAQRLSFRRVHERLVTLYIGKYFPLDIESELQEHEDGGDEEAAVNKELREYLTGKFANGEVEAKRLIPEIHPVFGYIQLEKISSDARGPGSNGFDEEAYSLKRIFGDENHTSVDTARGLYQEWRELRVSNDSCIDVLWTPEEQRIPRVDTKKVKQRASLRRNEGSAPQNLMHQQWRVLATDDANAARKETAFKKEIDRELDDALSALAKRGPGGDAAYESELETHSQLKKSKSLRTNDPRKEWHAKLQELAGGAAMSADFKKENTANAEKKQEGLDRLGLERRKRFEDNLNLLMLRTRERETEKRKMTPSQREVANQVDQNFVTSWNLDVQLKYRQRLLSYTLQDIANDKAQNTVSIRERQMDARVAYLDALKEDGLLDDAEAEIKRMVTERKALAERSNVSSESDAARKINDGANESEVNAALDVLKEKRLEKIAQFDGYLRESKEKREERKVGGKKSRRLSPQEREDERLKVETEYQSRGLSEKLAIDALARQKYEASASSKPSAEYTEVKAWVDDLSKEAQQASAEGQEQRNKHLYDKVYEVLDKKYIRQIATLSEFKSEGLQGGKCTSDSRFKGVCDVLRKADGDVGAALRIVRAQKTVYSSNILKRAMGRTLYAEWRLYLDDKADELLTPKQRESKRKNENQKAYRAKYDGLTEAQKDGVLQEEIDDIQKEVDPAFERAFDEYKVYTEDDPGADDRERRTKLSDLVAYHLGEPGRKMKRARVYRAVKREREEGQAEDLDVIKARDQDRASSLLDLFVYEQKKRAFGDERFGESEQMSVALKLLETYRQLAPLRSQLASAKKRLLERPDDEYQQEKVDVLQEQIKNLEEVQTFAANVKATLDSVVRQTYRLDALMKKLGTFYAQIDAEPYKDLKGQLEKEDGDFKIGDPLELFLEVAWGASAGPGIHTILLKGDLIEKYKKIEVATMEKEKMANRKRDEEREERNKKKAEEARKNNILAIADEMAEERGLYSKIAEANVLTFKKDKSLKPVQDMTIEEVYTSMESVIEGNDEAEEELSHNDRSCKERLLKIAKNEIAENGDTLRSWFTRTSAQFFDSCERVFETKLDLTYQTLLSFVMQDPSRRPTDPKNDYMEREGELLAAPGLTRNYATLEYMKNTGLVRDRPGNLLFFGSGDYKGSTNETLGRSPRITAIMYVDKTLLPFDSVPTPCKEILQWQSLVQGSNKEGQWELTPPRMLRHNGQMDAEYLDLESKFRDVYRYCYIRMQTMRYREFKSKHSTWVAEAAKGGVIKVVPSPDRPPQWASSNRWDLTDYVRLSNLPVWGGDSEKYANVALAVNFIFESVLNKCDETTQLRHQAEDIMGIADRVRTVASNLPQERVYDAPRTTHCTHSPISRAIPAHATLTRPALTCAGARSGMFCLLVRLPCERAAASAAMDGDDEDAYEDAFKSDEVTADFVNFVPEDYEQLFPDYEDDDIDFPDSMDTGGDGENSDSDSKPRPPTKKARVGAATGPETLKDRLRMLVLE